jgi:outer membrane receptor protein involved in Fe transport
VSGQAFARIGGPQPAREFRPDELWSYEAGAKLSLFRERLHVQAAAFYTVWRDIQTDQYLRSGLPFTANVGKGVNRGLEVEAAWRASRRLDVRANLLLDDPELTEIDPTYAARADNSLPVAPQVSFGVAADYRRPLSPTLTGILRAQAEYIGRSGVSFEAQTSPNMGDYVVARLSAGVQTARWRLTAYVDNPADTRNDTFAFGNPFSYRRVHELTPQRPRTFGVTVAADF